MLDMKIREKPKNLLDKILNLKIQVKKLEDDYDNKFRGELYVKRKFQLINKMRFYKESINKLGKEGFNKWYIEIEYLDDEKIGPTKFEMILTSFYDKEDVETLIKMKYNCFVNVCKLIKNYTCGEIIPLKK